MTASDNRVTAIRNSAGSPKTIGDEIFDFSILFMGMTHRTTGPRPIVFLPLPDVFEYNYTTFYDFLLISHQRNRLPRLWVSKTFFNDRSVPRCKIKHLEFRPKTAPLRAQYELGHLWGSYETDIYCSVHMVLLLDP